MGNGFGVSIETVAEFVGEVHDVLKDRPVYYSDYIEGHCLIPNTKILKSAHPSKVSDFIIGSNEARKGKSNKKVSMKRLKELRKQLLGSLT